MSDGKRDFQCLLVFLILNDIAKTKWTILAFLCCREILKNLFLPPGTKLWQGNVFTPVCHSVHGESGIPPWDKIPPEHTPPRQTPPGSRHPPEHTPHLESRHPQSKHPQEQTSPQCRHPLSRHPREQTPPPGADTPLHSAYLEIRATSGRYACYWNAHLLLSPPPLNILKLSRHD